MPDIHRSNGWILAEGMEQIRGAGHRAMHPLTTIATDGQRLGGVSLQRCHHLALCLAQPWTEGSAAQDLGHLVLSQADVMPGRVNS